MGKLANTAFAFGLGLSASILAGCGEQAIEQDAHIVGFARGIDGQIIEKQWVRYNDKDYLPRGARLLDHDEVFEGCREVENGYFSLGLDDRECWNDYWCEGTETTHCEAEYNDRYDYEIEQDVVVIECPAPIVRLEYKPSTDVSDEACMAQATRNQKVSRTSRFILWVQTLNPKHSDKNSDKEPAVLVGSRDVTAREWQKASQQTAARVKIVGGQITSITFKT